MMDWKCNMLMVGNLALLLLGSAFILVPLALALGGLLHDRPGDHGVWGRRYTVARAVGAALGGLLALLLTFVIMAISGGLPKPWNVLIFPAGGLAGALLGAVAYAVPVALVHGIWWIATSRARKAPATVPDDPLLP